MGLTKPGPLSGPCPGLASAPGRCSKLGLSLPPPAAPGCSGGTDTGCQTLPCRPRSQCCSQPCSALTAPWQSHASFGYRCRSCRCWESTDAATSQFITKETKSPSFICCFFSALWVLKAKQIQAADKCQGHRYPYSQTVSTNLAQFRYTSRQCQGTVQHGHRQGIFPRKCLGWNCLA